LSKKLPTQVWLLGGVSFFADVSSEMIYPLLPMFIVAVLGASATDMGWIEGIAQGTVALMAAWAGTRSDRFARRMPWVRFGYMLPVVGRALLVVASSWPLVLIGRTVDRLGKGFRSSPRDALIADITPVEIRGRAYGLDRAMDTAGAFVGVIVSAILLWWLAGSPNGKADPNAHVDPHPFRIVFGIAAAMGLVAVALTFVIREPAVKQEAKKPDAPGAAKMPAAYWQTLAILLVFAIANSSDTFILLRAANVGLSPWAVVAAYAMYNLVYTVASYPAGALSDRIGRWWLVGIGWAIYAIAYVGFAVATPALIWPLFAFYGLFTALTDGVGKALIADHAPVAHRGRALGIFYLATGGATIASSVLAGIVWDRFGAASTFWLGGVTAAIALVVLIIVRPRRG
jgi:MFS family permease